MHFCGFSVTLRARINSHGNTGSVVVFSANRTPLFREDGGPHVDVHVSC